MSKLILMRDKIMIAIRRMDDLLDSIFLYFIPEIKKYSHTLILA